MMIRSLRFSFWLMYLFDVLPEKARELHYAGENAVMKNISLEKELIRIDYTAEQVPDSVKNFRPDVYRDGDEYYLILGNDEHAIVGRATSIDEAMRRWDEAYWKKRYDSGNK